MTQIVVALGANVAGHWGAPASTLKRAIAELQAFGAVVQELSGLYLTQPVGPVRQPAFYNAVAIVQGNISPAMLLRFLKACERSAGRRQGLLWGPRPLDIDVIDMQGRVIGWPVRRRIAGRLLLPHPEAHRRAFVLGPLMQIAPNWRHPVLGRTARSLWLALPAAERGSIKRVVDRGFVPCDK